MIESESIDIGSKQKLNLGKLSDVWSSEDRTPRHWTWGEAATQSHLLKIQFVVAATYAEISDAGE